LSLTSNFILIINAVVGFTPFLLPLAFEGIILSRHGHLVIKTNTLLYLEVLLLNSLSGLSRGNILAPFFLSGLK
jgi:hypothetical protein